MLHAIDSLLRHFARWGSLEHRALDDTKTARVWLTSLSEMKEDIYSAPRRRTAISLAALRDYYAKIHARRQFLEREGHT